MSIYTKTALFILLTIEVFSVLPPKQVRAVHSRYLRGIIHVHSLFSDGGGTPEEIMTAADEADADFVILTDHNNRGARKEHEKAYNGRDLYVELEASLPAGHALAFSSLSGAAEEADSKIVDLAFKHFLGTETSPGFFIALAHPSNIKNPWNRLDRFSDGYEVVNFDSLWQRLLSNSVLNFLTTLAIYPFNNYLAALKAFDVYDKDLSAWDVMSSSPGRHFGILAHDTHAKLKLNREWWWKWPGYAHTFRLASNIVFMKDPISPDFSERKKQVYQAIRNGQMAIAFDSIHEFAGNEWSAECGDKRGISGDVVPWKAGCIFKVKLPELPFDSILKLRRNGIVVEEKQGALREAAFDIQSPGTYRLEVWLKAHTLFRFLLNREVPYILYNPMELSAG